MKANDEQRVIFYPTISGTFYRHRCIKPGPKPLPLELKKRRINVALAPYWHEKGKQIAAEKGLSFSSYLESLIYTDSLCNESA